MWHSGFPKSVRAVRQEHDTCAHLAFEGKLRQAGPEHMSSQFDAAITLIDEANGQDPKMISADGGQYPAELIYSRRMSETLTRIYPQASVELQLAVRAQHLKRWTLPRSDFPMDRKGYHAWRNAAKDMHANQAGEMMAEAGFDAEKIARVQSLVLKQGIKRDDDAQALEDVACLVFLEHYFSAFAMKHDHDKIIGIVQKTWNKMSEHGQAEALKLPMDESQSQLVQEALSG
jgi:hypothetical protein